MPLCQFNDFFDSTDHEWTSFKCHVEALEKFKDIFATLELFCVISFESMSRLSDDSLWSAHLTKIARTLPKPFQFLVVKP